MHAHAQQAKQPVPPEKAAHIRYINDIAFMRASHITMTQLETDYAAGEMEVTDEKLNHHGFLHGGMLTMLADSIAGAAAGSRGGRCVTLDNTMHYLRPATGRRIFCSASPVRVGRTVSTFEALLTDEEGRTVAKGTFTFHINRGILECPIM